MKIIMENWRRFVEESGKEKKEAPKKVRSRANLRKQDMRKRKLGKEDKDQFAYVFGTVDGQKLEAQNEDKRFYGASMPKPILLLAAQAVDYPVSDEKIKGLLNYVGNGALDSNEVFRELTRLATAKYIVDPDDPNPNNKKKKRIKNPHYQKAIQKKYIYDKGISGDLASAEFPEDRVIGDLKEQNYSKMRMDIINSWSENKQSPLEFFNFLVFLNKNNFAESHPDKEIQQIQKVLSVMKRTYFGEDPNDRELKGLKKIERAMKSAGLPVNKVYGKGGKDAGVLNYGIIIDDEYIMCIYTDMSPKHSSKDANRDAGYRIRKIVNQKIIDVYKSATGISPNEYEDMQPPVPNMSTPDD